MSDILYVCDGKRCNNCSSPECRYTTDVAHAKNFSYDGVADCWYEDTLKTNKEETTVNNETVKRFDLTIKLRGDNVYDLYLNGEWIASRGSHEGILDEARSAIKERLLREEDSECNSDQ